MRTVRAVRQALYVFYGVVGNSYTPPVECLSHHRLGINGLDVFWSRVCRRGRPVAHVVVEVRSLRAGIIQVVYLVCWIGTFRSVVRELALVVTLVINAGVTHDSCSAGVECLTY